MFTGINYFRELALYYDKHEEYPYADEYQQIYNEFNPASSKIKRPVPFDALPYYMQEFALYWIDKVINGDKHGDTIITGEQMFYMNNIQIERTVVNSPGVHKNNPTHERKVGRRTMAFPDFWDEDWRYYWVCDIARDGLTNGLELEEYKVISKPCDLGLIETPENLRGTLDVVWGKPRGVGASWKGGSYAAYNQFLVKDSNTFIMAETEEYLLKDGIFEKYDKIRSFVQSNCWWLSKHFYKESLSEFQFNTGSKELVNGAKVIKGFNTLVAGVTIDGVASKARGKRGNIVLEEFGSFPSADAVWNVLDASTNEYGTVYGQRRGFGTGGDEGGDFMFLEKMFNDPKSYNLIQCKNYYDEFKKPIPFFTPCYTNITDKDENGNSQQHISKAKFDIIEKNLLEADDVTLITKHKAEYPRVPGDMFKSITGNILPSDLADKRLTYLEATKEDRKLCSYGILEKTKDGVKFFPKNVLPFEEYPVNNDGKSKKGCISIFQEPIKIQGVIPNNIYIISVDAYTQDEAQESQSVGSARVWEQPNKYTRFKGNIIPAWYVARPEGFNGSEEFAKNIFLLAEFYNAKISLENDQVGELVSYAKKNTDSKGRKLTLYLAEQFDIGFDEKLATKQTMKRMFGMNMSERRKKEGLKYFKEWLLTPVGFDLEGNQILRIDLIQDRGLLKEIKYYKYGKNADRISDCIIGMYHIKEEEYQDMKRSYNNQHNNLLISLKLY